MKCTYAIAITQWNVHLLFPSFNDQYVDEKTESDTSLAFTSTEAIQSHSGYFTMLRDNSFLFSLQNWRL